jgi:NAD(P)-dependent dehydrogenase (short-subunit alcohol dehydrogenase family)
LHCNRNVSGAEALRRTLTEGRHAVLSGDLTSIDDTRSVVEGATAATGRAPVIVVDAAFPAVAPGSASELTDEDIARHLDGFRMHVNVCRAATPGMRDAGHGRVVLVSGALATRNFEGFALYAAVKAGLMSFSRTLAIEEGRYGITVNAVAPGRVATDEEQADDPADLPEPFARLDALMRLRRALPRYATPEDVAHVVAFLVAPTSGAVTGQVVYLAAGEPV